MNSSYALILITLLYAVFVIWLIKNKHIAKMWKDPFNDVLSKNKIPLVRFVKKVLDLFLFLLLLIVIAMPIILIVTIFSQGGAQSWGVDIGVFAGFMLNLNDIAGVEALGVRQQEFSGKGIINVDTSNPSAWYFFVMMNQISAFVAIYVIVQLRQMLFSLQSNRPFNQENPLRIKRIGIAVILWNVINPLLQYFGWGAIVKQITFNTSGVTLIPASEINMIALIVGLMMWLLSGLFKEAAEMKKEQELTI